MSDKAREFEDFILDDYDFNKLEDWDLEYLWDYVETEDFSDLQGEGGHYDQANDGGGEQAGNRPNEYSQPPPQASQPPRSSPPAAAAPPQFPAPSQSQPQSSQQDDGMREPQEEPNAGGALPTGGGMPNFGSSPPSFPEPSAPPDNQAPSFASEMNFRPPPRPPASAEEETEDDDFDFNFDEDEEGFEDSSADLPEFGADSYDDDPDFDFNFDEFDNADDSASAPQAPSALPPSPVPPPQPPSYTPPPAQAYDDENEEDDDFDFNFDDDEDSDDHSEDGEEDDEDPDESAAAAPQYRPADFPDRVQTSQGEIDIENDNVLAKLQELAFDEFVSVLRANPRIFDKVLEQGEWSEDELEFLNSLAPTVRQQKIPENLVAPPSYEAADTDFDDDNEDSETAEIFRPQTPLPARRKFRRTRRQKAQTVAREEIKQRFRSLRPKETSVGFIQGKMAEEKIRLLEILAYETEISVNDLFDDEIAYIVADPERFGRELTGFLFKKYGSEILFLLQGQLKLTRSSALFAESLQEINDYYFKPQDGTDFTCEWLRGAVNFLQSQGLMI